MNETRTWTGRVFIGASLDGFIARPNGDIDWLTDAIPGPNHTPPTSSHRALDWDTFYPGVDHLVMGRGTYEKVLTFGQWPYTGKTVIVLSTTLTADDPNIVIAPTLDDALHALQSGAARQVYVDGGQVIQTFLRQGLIDEITIGWAPVLIGQGLALFGPLNQDIQLALTSTHASDSGMVHATYRVHR
ncbi:dihydrofolate reductase family protein [Actinomycetaceae bacterium L2_0104]|uniref:dihydrofolate reductase family protein n=1 Tax=Brachybacterium epidermidis TaxID=2781983 RepID=UPI00398F472E